MINISKATCLPSYSNLQPCLIFVTLLLTIISPNTSYSWDCVIPSPEELISEPDLIFRGIVLNVSQLKTEDSLKRNKRLRPIIAKFMVKKNIKGPNFKTIEVIHKPSVESAWRFKNGNETIVFAGLKEDGGYRLKYCFMESYHMLSKHHPTMRQAYDLALGEP